MFHFQASVQAGLLPCLAWLIGVQQEICGESPELPVTMPHIFIQGHNVMLALDESEDHLFRNKDILRQVKKREEGEYPFSSERHVELNHYVTRTLCGNSNYVCSGVNPISRSLAEIGVDRTRHIVEAQHVPKDTAKRLSAQVTMFTRTGV